MPKTYFAQAFAMLFRTSPCVGTIFGANLLFGAALLIYLVILYYLLVLLGDIPLVGLVLVVGGTGAPLFAYRVFKGYVLYLLRAGHVAVMAEYLKSGSVPAGQLSWGKEQVQRRFRDVSIMSGVDVLLRGVVGAITNLGGGVVGLLPIPGLDRVISMIKVVIRMATDYVDEAILARAYTQNEDNVWNVAKDGVILYAMAWKPILLQAAGLAVISWASFGVFIVLWAPVGLAMSYLLTDSLLPSLAVLGLAYLSKVALADSFALAATMIAYHHETKDLVPDLKWDERLSQCSADFVKLKDMAMTKVRGQVVQPTATDAAIPSTELAPAAI